MTAPAITVPDTVPPEWLPEPDDGGTENDVIHLECCDPEVALCGEPLDGYEDAEPDEPGERCAICQRIDELDLGCGMKFCKLRQRWRSRRWFR